MKQKTTGNLNNHIGLPLSILSIDETHELAVLEFGASKLGDITELCEVGQPNFGLITNIGEAHLENFKNIKGIAKAKSEIIESIKRGGKIILNRDDKLFNFLYQKAKSFNLEIITFGKHRESNILLKKINEKNGNSKIFVNIDNQSLIYEFRDINIYNIY